MGGLQDAINTFALIRIVFTYTFLTLLLSLVVQGVINFREESNVLRYVWPRSFFISVAIPLLALLIPVISVLTESPRRVFGSDPSAWDTAWTQSTWLIVLWVVGLSVTILPLVTMLLANLFED